MAFGHDAADSRAHRVVAHDSVAPAGPRLVGQKRSRARRQELDVDAHPLVDVLLPLPDADPRAKHQIADDDAVLPGTTHLYSVMPRPNPTRPPALPGGAAQVRASTSFRLTMDRPNKAGDDVKKKLRSLGATH